MAVTQGFGELVPLYKLMEKRDMAALENQMKVSEGIWTFIACHETDSNTVYVNISNENQSYKLNTMMVAANEYGKPCFKSVQFS